MAQEREMSAQIERNNNMMVDQTPVATQVRPSTANAGNTGGFFGTVSNLFTQAGNTLSSAFGSGIPQLFGIERPRSAVQQPAITSNTGAMAQETQASGVVQAGIGNVLPTVVGAARGLLKSPLGQTAFGTGLGLGVSMIGADGKPMRITRKMKSQLKSLLNQTNKNYALVGDFLNLTTEQMLFILNKRFRNDGPVVTKAALRKTKSTIRKLKNMCDMYDDLRPAARRRTPMRRATRASTTLIKN